MLQDKIIENQRRLEQIEKENRLAQSRVDQVSHIVASDFFCVSVR